jgi:N-methylhydantoinase B
MLIETERRPLEPAPKFGLLTCERLRIRASSPGGGGFGDPSERDPLRVLQDVRDGLVSPQVAHDVYGVVLTSDGKNVDAAATAIRRRA